MSPAAETLLAFGDTLRLTAEALDANGHAVADARFQWMSSDTLVVTVDSTGLTTGGDPGEAVVTATASGVVGRAQLSVQERTPTEVAVAPDTVGMSALADTVRLRAEVRDQTGALMEGVRVSWSSGDTLVATVDSAGLATATGNGTVAVTAAAGGASGNATVTVEQVPASVVVEPDSLVFDAITDTARVTATFFDANGYEIADAAEQWESADRSVATVDASGLVTATANGATTVTASAGLVSVSATVKVEQVIARVSVRPGSLAPAHAGKQGPDTVVVTVTDRLGSPIVGASYKWTTDRNSGWVWPAQGNTSEQGRLSATWVAGWPGNGVLSLTVDNEASSLSTEIGTRSTQPANADPTGGVAIFMNNDHASALSIDMTPLTEPLRTYYAMQWEGGYTGLQRRGSHYDRQLQFSVWDVADGDGSAQVVEIGDGVNCYTFGGEGTGIACNLEYPWSVGSTYRFEVAEREMGGGSAMTVHVTDVKADERRFVGTLYRAHRVNMTGFVVWGEDFSGTATNCLDRNLVSAAIKRAMALIEGEWRPITHGGASRHFHDYRNPGTPGCANSGTTRHPSGLRFAFGGETASDPDDWPRRVEIPR